MPVDFYDVVHRRRDVRGQFTGADLDPATLLRILAAAHAAPSVGMTQPWDFVIVSDLAVRRRFHSHVMAERDAFGATLTGERRTTYDGIKIEGILQATVGVVVSYDEKRGAPAVLGRNTIADTGLYSTCLAIENLWLAATTEGLGVGWVSFYREPFLRDLIGMPDSVRPVAWLCLGPVSHLATVPDLEAHGWRSRRPLADAVHYERFPTNSQ